MCIRDSFQGVPVLEKIHSDSGKLQMFIQYDLLEKKTIGVLHADMEIIYDSASCLFTKGIYGFHGGNTADKKPFKIVFDLQENTFKLLKSIISKVFDGDCLLYTSFVTVSHLPFLNTSYCLNAQGIPCAECISLRSIS